MLKALWEIEESWYPASTSAKPAPKTTDWYRYNSHHNLLKKGDGYIARPANIDQQDPPAVQEEEPSVAYPEAKLEAKYNDGYYCDVMNTADTIDCAFDHCYNCMREGHRWRDCPDDLKPELKAALNCNGGTGVKGGHAPQTTGLAKTPLAKAKQ